MAKKTLAERTDRIHKLAERLMEVETMSSDEFLTLLAEG